MSWLDHLRPHSITTQITGIVAVAVLLGIIFTVTIMILFESRALDHRPSAAAARISSMAHLIRAAENPDGVDAIIIAIRRTGVEVMQVPLNELLPATSALPILSRFVVYQLKQNPAIDVIEGVKHRAGPDQQIAVRVDDRSALIFDALAGISIWQIIKTPTALMLVIVLLAVLFLSIYAVRWIVAPLSMLAIAADSFGRSPESDCAVIRPGPREIAKVAEALNDMRTRIRALIDDRTRVLTAISHDLRTPLTRLRLRVERVSEQTLRNGMLRELAQIGRMLDETLDYLRQDARSESMSRVDLPSLLQTVCVDFSDVGHDVRYEGPDRLTWTCRPSSLIRAVSNIVDNGVKHASAVTVSLQVHADGTAEIDVSDDGPGIPKDLCERVFEPFFKIDNARVVLRGGFGLGLSIASDVVKMHGGQITLMDRQPHGLIVRIALPTGPATAVRRAIGPLARRSSCHASF